MNDLPIYEVVRQRFYAGAHPLWLLPRLVEEGVRTFIDLTELEELQARNPQYQSYEPQLQELEQTHHAVLTRYSFPIEDFGVPTHEILESALHRIDIELSHARPIYVHCWGGYGRTGIVVGSWLIRHHLATPESFVDTIAQLRAHLPNHFSSPVTSHQKSYVREYAALTGRASAG